MFVSHKFCWFIFSAALKDRCVKISREDFLWRILVKISCEEFLWRFLVKNSSEEFLWRFLRKISITNMNFSCTISRCAHPSNWINIFLVFMQFATYNCYHPYLFFFSPIFLCIFSLEVNRFISIFICTQFVFYDPGSIFARWNYFKLYL